MQTKALAIGATLLMTAFALAGCFGQDSSGSGDDGDTTSPTPSPTGGNGGWVVTITSVNETAGVAEPIQVDWSVTPDDPAVEVTSTTVLYGGQSVPDPQSPSDYGNSSGEYVGSTPGNFSTNFTVEEAGTIYVRAHAVIDGVDYWSSEEMVEVTGGASGEAVTVRITNGALPYLSTFNPAEVTIKVGDSVQWMNDDDAVHSAEAVDGSFDTGDIAAGNTSAPVTFDTPGEYQYRCGHHPQTMMGTIIVEAA